MVKLLSSGQDIAITFTISSSLYFLTGPALNWNYEESVMGKGVIQRTLTLP